MKLKMSRPVLGMFLRFDVRLCVVVAAHVLWQAQAE